jgi:hypothetical protein
LATSAMTFSTSSRGRLGFKTTIMGKAGSG